MRCYKAKTAAYKINSGRKMSKLQDQSGFIFFPLFMEIEWFRRVPFITYLFGNIPMIFGVKYFSLYF